MTTKTTLIVKCGWCGKAMGEKDGQGISGISHGMCKKCYDKAMADMEIADDLKSYWANLNAGSER